MLVVEGRRKDGGEGIIVDGEKIMEIDDGMVREVRERRGDGKDGVWGEVGVEFIKVGIGEVEVGKMSKVMKSGSEEMMGVEDE